jgi:hypothetical protein
MGFRFYRRFRIFPGLRLNLSRSGISTSVGRRGAWFTFGHGKTRETVSLPGSGLSYTHISKSRQTDVEAPGAEQSSDLTEPMPQGRAWRGWLWLLLLVAIAACVVWLLTTGEHK